MIDKIKENWEKILLILREEYGDQITDISYKTWLEPLKPYSFKGNTITIIVPEQPFISYVKKKYSTFLKVTISEFLGKECEVDLKQKNRWRQRNSPPLRL